VIRRAVERPDRVFDDGLQHERNALAWERTAISAMVGGVLLARYAAQTLHWIFAAFGMLTVVIGGGLLVWTGRHYDDLHGPLRAGASPVHPTAARIVGRAAIAFALAALALSVVIAFER
jgi:uncharacterized membrane protein YidH (DUF202 family)